MKHRLGCRCGSEYPSCADLGRMQVETKHDPTNTRYDKASNDWVCGACHKPVTDRRYHYLFVVTR
jgi:hypothetical protein